MKEIVRMQHTLQIGKDGNALVRHHPIPKDVRDYAKKLQSDLSEERGPNQTPTLADIYLHLVGEGINLVKQDTVFGEDFGRRITRVKYPFGELNDRLLNLKSEVTAGKYQNIPSVRKDGRVYKEGVLELIPVTLMRLAISERLK